MSDRVWVVDDNELILRMIFDILSKNGYQVKSFNHPAVVINKLMSHQSSGSEIELPQVMLVDYWMPDLKGPDLVRTIRKLGPPFTNISFIGFTSSDAPAADAEFASLGMFVLRKPDFHESDLLIRVMRAQVDRDKTGSWEIKK